VDSPHIYRHFCMGARALEVVGERWSLLIVRDLLLGPLRFTDLVRGLNEISPTRLIDRLRRLEAASLVVREAPPSGREVWYRLTDAGLDLEPVVDALILWGIEHRLDPPRRGEPVCPVPLMVGTKVWLNRNAVEVDHPVSWVWHFGPDDPYTMRFDEGRWVLARGDSSAAAVTINATPEAWARALTTKPDERRFPDEDLELVGKPSALRDFARLFGTTLRSA
jgi:DNA-binding HxlR family transcriptional regulator